MKNFKPGQKVVFTTENLKEDFGHCDTAILPKEKEVVTIESINENPVWIILKEYPKTTNGYIQFIHEMVLFPLEEITNEETEKIFSKLTKSIKQLETV